MVFFLHNKLPADIIHIQQEKNNYAAIKGDFFSLSCNRLFEIILDSINNKSFIEQLSTLLGACDD